VRQCISARAALAALKQAALLIPNQGMLVNTLPLLEARASSEIENIVTTTDKLFRGLGSEEHADPATKEKLFIHPRLLKLLTTESNDFEQFPIDSGPEVPLSEGLSEGKKKW